MHLFSASRCYAVVGVIVSSSPRLIYSRMNSNCLLPQLVDCLLLPLATTRTPPTTHVQATCVRNHLHQVTQYPITIQYLLNFRHGFVEYLLSHIVKDNPCCSSSMKLIPKFHFLFYSLWRDCWVLTLTTSSRGSYVPLYHAISLTTAHPTHPHTEATLSRYTHAHTYTHTHSRMHAHTHTHTDTGPPVD